MSSFEITLFVICVLGIFVSTFFAGKYFGSPIYLPEEKEEVVTSDLADEIVQTMEIAYLAPTTSPISIIPILENQYEVLPPVLEEVPAALVETLIEEKTQLEKELTDLNVKYVKAVDEVARKEKLRAKYLRKLRDQQFFGNNTDDWAVDSTA